MGMAIWTRTPATFFLPSSPNEKDTEIGEAFRTRSLGFWNVGKGLRKQGLEAV
jgi:hypothetical protein